MNSCYGCVLQESYPDNAGCKACTPEGSQYQARIDFNEWHRSNCTPKAESAEKSDNEQSEPCSAMSVCNNIKGLHCFQKDACVNYEK